MQVFADGRGQAAYNIACCTACLKVTKEGRTKLRTAYADKRLYCLPKPEE